MTDETNQTPGENNNAAPSAEDNSRRNRARNKIVEYADADAELKELMEKVMEPIDKSPDSFEAIITYGHAPLEELGKIANSMIAVQTRFNDQVNVMASAMDKLQTGMKGMSMDKFADATKNLLKGLSDAGAKTVSGGFNIGKRLAKAFTGGNKPKTDDEKLLEEMQNALPAMLNEMIRLVDDIDKTGDGIREVLKEAEKLGEARVRATRSINVYLGASKEVLRRYKEEYIPQAQADYEESADPEDEMYLKDLLKRQDDFLNRISVLEGSRLQGVIAAQQLKQIMETMEDQLKSIEDIKHNGQNEWKAMLAAAGIAGSALKAAQSIKKANEFGDKMSEQTDKMLDEAHQLTLDSKGRPTVSVERLIESAKMMEKRLESEAEARKTKLRQLEESSIQLRGAADKLIESVNEADNRRMLEGLKEVEKSNDNNGARRSTKRSGGPGPK